MIKCTVYILNGVDLAQDAQMDCWCSSRSMLFASAILNMFEPNFLVKKKRRYTLSPFFFFFFFYKENNFCDYVFAFLKALDFLKRIFSKRKEFALMGRKVLPFKPIPFQEGGKTIWKSYLPFPPLKVYPFSLSLYEPCHEKKEPENLNYTIVKYGKTFFDHPTRH